MPTAPHQADCTARKFVSFGLVPSVKAAVVAMRQSSDVGVASEVRAFVLEPVIAIAVPPLSEVVNARAKTSLNIAQCFEGHSYARIKTR